MYRTRGLLGPGHRLMSGRRVAFLAVLTPVLLGLAACSPVPVAQAERICLDDARAARSPQGEVGFGVGSGGFRGGYLSIGVSSDYIAGRDPSDVYNNCVMRRSGQMPTRPLYEQPGWRGK